MLSYNPLKRGKTNLRNVSWVWSLSVMVLNHHRDRPFCPFVRFPVCACCSRPEIKWQKLKVKLTGEK